MVFYSAQKGYKRHPETVRRQMQILQSVPNSCFLIKGLSDQAVIRDAFIEIASQEGVSGDRLRFCRPQLAKRYTGPIWRSPM
ncbi:MAG: hypothetical protein HC919_04800 [Oscillatoriales cyanobacterium SM2_2_1]|nr:hypothetical protein [Oscillatoriales cyanobacterium SM2_2_1]